MHTGGVRAGTTSFVTLGGLMAVIVMVTLASGRLSELSGAVSGLAGQPSKRIQMQTITQEVTRRDDSKVTISTVRAEGEAVDAWLARHDEAVAVARGV